jgi:hypothetical protein
MKRQLYAIGLFFVIICFFTSIQCVVGQVISSETIKEDVTAFITDTSSVDYYVSVKNIFETEESKLTERQFYLLYYGQGAKPEKKYLYPSLFLNTDRMQLEKMVSNSKFKKAISLAENLIKINPLDITTLIYLAMSIDMASGDKDNKYYKRMKNLITAMLKTGDGKSPETAIKIANIGDDSAVIGFTGFQGVSKQEEEINGKHYSVWRNRFGDKFYFEYVLLF